MCTKPNANTHVAIIALACLVAASALLVVPVDWRWQTAAVICGVMPTMVTVVVSNYLRYGYPRAGIEAMIFCALGFTAFVLFAGNPENGVAVLGTRDLVRGMCGSAAACIVLATWRLAIAAASLAPMALRPR